MAIGHCPWPAILYHDVVAEAEVDAFTSPVAVTETTTTAMPPTTLRYVPLGPASLASDAPG